VNWITSIRIILFPNLPVQMSLRGGRCLRGIGWDLCCVCSWSQTDYMPGDVRNQLRYHRDHLVVNSIHKKVSRRRDSIPFFRVEGSTETLDGPYAVLMPRVD
jgi:hypothetical protein